MNHSRPNITDTLKKCYPFWEKLTDTQKEQLKTSSYIRDYEPGSFVHSRSEEPKNRLWQFRNACA